MAQKHSDLEVAVVPQTYPMPYVVESTIYEQAESIERSRSPRNYTGTYEKLDASFSDAEADRSQPLPVRTRRRRPWVWIIAIVVIALGMLGVGIGIGYSVGKNSVESGENTSPSSTPKSATDSSTAANTATSTAANSGTSTSSASTPTATVALNCSNSGKYTSSSSVFTEECGIDYAGNGPTYNGTGTVTDVGVFAVDSFEACMDECVKQNGVTPNKCSAVTFSAIQPDKAAFGNCWTKSARGQKSDKDVDESITASAYLDE